MSKSSSDILLEVIRAFRKGNWEKKANNVVRNKKKMKKLLVLVAVFLQYHSWGTFRTNMLLLYHYVKDIVSGAYKDYHIAKLVTIVAVLLYVLSPLDLIPDFVVGLGFLDDAALVSYAIGLAGNELAQYQDWRKNVGKCM